MANKADGESAKRPFAAAAFLREQVQPVKTLAGYRKDAHRIPDIISSSNEAFIAKLASADLAQDMDQRYAALKSAFAFKRVDLEVSDPADGAGTIITPLFTYHIQVSQNQANPAEVVWQRRVADIHSPAQALSEAFAEVFNKTFDTLEFVPAEPVDVKLLIDRIEDLEDSRITVDYDRAATSCTLVLAGVKGEISVTDSMIKFHQRAVADPRKLVESLMKIQKALAEILPLSFV